MRFFLRFLTVIFTVCVVSACGGGGGGSGDSSVSNPSPAPAPTPPPTPTPTPVPTPPPTPSAFVPQNILSGKVVDGYVSGAKVYIDQNFNRVFDDGEVFGITGENGDFFLNEVINNLVKRDLISPDGDYVPGNIISSAQFEEYELDSESLNPWEISIDYFDLVANPLQDYPSKRINPAPNDLNNLSSIVNNTSSTELGNRQILFQSDYQDAVQEDDKIILSTKLFNKTEILDDWAGLYNFSLSARIPEGGLNFEEDYVDAGFFIKVLKGSNTQYQEVLSFKNLNADIKEQLKSGEWVNLSLTFEIHEEMLGSDLEAGLYNSINNKQPSAVVFDNATITQQLSFTEDYFYTSQSAIDEVDRLYACWRNRPLIADVPAGAYDASIGTVSKAYEMMLPSVNDSRTDALIISPFSNFLEEGVINGINAANINNGLSDEESCSAKGDEVANVVSNAVEEVTRELGNLFGITYQLLVSDYVAGNSSDVITQAKAEKIAAWLPALRGLRSQISDRISSQVGQRIYPDLVTSKESRNALLNGEDLGIVPLQYQLAFNSEIACLATESCSDWYYTTNFRSTGARLGYDGVLHPFRRPAGSDNYFIYDYSLDGISDAAERHDEYIYFIQRSDAKIEGHEDLSLAIFQEKQSRFQDINGNLSTSENYDEDSLFRVCTYMDQIDSRLPEEFEGINTTFRNNISVRRDNRAFCGGIVNEEPSFNLFFRHQATGEYVSVQYISTVEDAVFLENKIVNLWENRLNLELKPFLDELRSLPRSFAQLNELRETANGWLRPTFKCVSFYFSKLKDDGTYDTRYFCMHLGDPAQDEYYDASTNPRGESFFGQEARNRFFDVLKNSEHFNSNEFAGSAAP